MGYHAADPADRTILVVEDDEARRGELVAYLAGYDYLVRGAGDPREMDEVLAQMPVDLLVLSAALPGEDGCPSAADWPGAAGLR